MPNRNPEIGVVVVVEAGNVFEVLRRGVRSGDVSKLVIEALQHIVGEGDKSIPGPNTPNAIRVPWGSPNERSRAELFISSSRGRL